MNKEIFKISLISLTTFIASSTAQAFTDLDSLQKRSEELINITQLENKKAIIRLSHAKELLGKQYKKSVVKTGEDVLFLDDLLVEWTEKGLAKPWKSMAQKVTQAIIAASEKYSFDPIFLMAVIENESSFNPKAVGTSGEIGLMQITPDTAKWISKKYNLPWKGTKSLKDPVTNIQIGAAYMAYLREKFDSESQLYIAAYNMGAGNVRKILGKQGKPKIYAGRVMQRYVRFYTQLKQQITTIASATN